MQKVNNNKLQELQRELSFYDFDKLDTKNNKELIIKFSSEIDKVTYNDLGFGGSVNNYNFKKELFYKIIHFITEKFDDNSCIIIKYDESWVVNKKKSKKLYGYIKENNIKNKCTKAIIIEKDFQIIKLFIESILKYNSFVKFIFKDSKIIVIPTDHMDIFIEYEDDSIIEKIKAEVIKCNNSEYVDELNIKQIFELDTINKNY